uniref:Leucine-rich repeat-containing protein 3-like n=1 Tax=Geotrypetes seraphini TaxID=260995 RepID=A0A6P8QX66_GEOSA|nr:leucine-rich repeat-containing protein 3-like [Geotrypetes seraphini]
MILVWKTSKFAKLFPKGGIFLVLFCFHMGTSCPRKCLCSDDAGLMVVYCNSRNLVGIPNDIPAETAFLKLNANKISQIPDNAFRHLNYLQELDLSQNSIEKIGTSAFTGMTERLKLLDLSNNHIHSISKEALAKVRAKIRLANNPWHCECILQVALQELQLDPETVDEITCHTSVQDEYTGKSLIRLLDSGIDFCSFEQKTTDVAMFIIMFGWFAMVITYVVYYVRHNQEDASRHSKYLKSLPSTQITKDFDTVSTVL